MPADSVRDLLSDAKHPKGHALPIERIVRGHITQPPHKAHFRSLIGSPLRSEAHPHQHPTDARNAPRGS
jgi:hypothetical protein